MKRTNSTTTHNGKPLIIIDSDSDEISIDYEEI